MAQDSLFGESRKFEVDKKHCLLLIGCQLIDFNWVEEAAMSICIPKEIKEVEIWLSFSNCEPWNFKHFPPIYSEFD